MFMDLNHAQEILESFLIYNNYPEVKNSEQITFYINIFNNVKDYKDMLRGKSVGRNNYVIKKKQTWLGTPHNTSLPVEEIHPPHEKRNKAISQHKKLIQSLLS